jgi:hypothetical protein
MKQTTVSGRWPWLWVATRRARAAAAIGTTVCSRRSFARSELQPTKSWPARARSGGRRMSVVSVSYLSEYHRSRMLGRKNSTP